MEDNIPYSDITGMLMIEYGFRKVRNTDREKLDLDKFTCVLRIGDIHYLYWSEHFKYFTLAMRHDKPKGTPGVKGVFESFAYMMIPKCIRTVEDAINLVNGICDFKYMRVIEQ